MLEIHSELQQPSPAASNEISQVIDPAIEIKRKAFSFYRKKNYSVASQFFRNLIQIENDFASLSYLAHSLYHLERYEEALNYYLQSLMAVVDENSELFEVYKNVGNIYAKLKDFEGAREYFNKAYILQPESDVISVNLATMEIQNQDYGTALHLFRRAININRNNDKAWTGLAMIHQQLGDTDLAMANLQFALEINIKNTTAIQLFVQWCLKEHKISEAIEKLSEHLSFQDFNKELSLLLVHLFLMQNNFHLALLEIERILLWQPHDEEALDIYNQIRSNIHATQN